LSAIVAAQTWRLMAVLHSYCFINEVGTTNESIFNTDNKCDDDGQQWLGMHLNDSAWSVDEMHNTMCEE
jgi:hypothetical protein